ncbi:hypothetical protein ACNHE5_01025 [Pandoraea pnomenusa]|uniref:hypothetical protein n=1 Tax=Pandoraea pnomenusa TaxID=93220 RepID=UPI003CF590AF
MGEVKPFKTKRDAIDGAGGPPNNGDMEARLKTLESTVSDIRERLAKIEVRLESSSSKADVAEVRAELHKAISAQTWKLIGSAGALVAVVYYVVTHVK